MSNTERVDVAGLSLTPAQIEAMKEGIPLSGSLKSGDLSAPAVVAPRNTVAISGYNSQIRPRVAGNDPAEGLVGGPSDDWAKRHSDQWQQEAAKEADRLKQQDESKAALTNESLRRDLEYLRRQVARMTKELKELKKDAES